MQAADAERREAAKKKAEAKEKKLAADEGLHVAAKTNNVWAHVTAADVLYSRVVSWEVGPWCMRRQRLELLLASWTWHHFMAHA